MRILVVSSFLPFPLHSGGHVRLYNLLKELSISHKITLVCEKRSNQTKQDIEEVKKFCEEVITIDRKKQWSSGNIVKTAVSVMPFLLVGHNLAEMKKKIVSVLSKKKFDVIHIETFYVYQNLPKTYLPRVLVEHNVEYEVYERFMKKSPAFVKPFLSVDIQKIKYWEEKIWREVTKLVAVSEEDKKKMTRQDVAVVPNGVDLGSFPFKPVRLAPFSAAGQPSPKGRAQSKSPSARSGQREKTILFMGDFKWIQNVDAVQFILKEIWPKIEKESGNRAVNLKLWIVGKQIPEKLKKYSSENIIFDDKAPEKTADIYKRADILLAPIQVGGGTSYKIIEAMASGVPVVTTPLGVKGLGAKSGSEAFVAETASELARGVITFLEDAKLYEHVRANARGFIEKNFSWKIIAKKLEEVYQSAVKENE